MTPVAPVAVPGTAMHSHSHKPRQLPLTPPETPPGTPPMSRARWELSGYVYDHENGGYRYDQSAKADLAAARARCGYPDLAPAAADAVAAVRDNVIGARTTVATPFGSKLVTYADYTASGRMLQCIEDAMRDVVAPMYANTHTEASATGLQTGHRREEARMIVRRGVGAGPGDHVIFTGSGSTAAIDKLQRMIPRGTDAVVFIGPFEHHSNELSWRHCPGVAEVVVIEEDARGVPDLEQLRRELEKRAAASLKLGSFSAGSNVTGIVPPVGAISALLHAHGAFACWDYAGAGPYVTIDMHPGDGADELRKDAVYISPHKFVGGPGSSGVLALSIELAERLEVLAGSEWLPTMPGGGTVTFASQKEARYAPGQSGLVAREEAGTPAILADIRAGLAFKVKEQVGAENIEKLERYWGERALDALAATPHVKLVGSNRAASRYPLPSETGAPSADTAERNDRLAIISFQIEWAGPKRAAHHAEVDSTLFSDRIELLHPHFVCAVLNDVYGIQSRSGCSCAGPYGHRLFGLNPDDATATMLKRCVVEQGLNVVKPGWCRINMSYFTDDSEFNFIIAAIRQVAEHGWKLLPLYRCDPTTGQFIHKSFTAGDHFEKLDGLGLVSRAGPDEEPRRGGGPPDDVLATELASCRLQILADANKLFDGLPAEIERLTVAEGMPILTAADSWGGPVQRVSELTTWMHQHRWFALGHDVVLNSRNGTLTADPAETSPVLAGESCRRWSLLHVVNV